MRRLNEWESARRIADAKRHATEHRDTERAWVVNLSQQVQLLAGQVDRLSQVIYHEQQIRG
ncbi:MbeD/MobD family mobilization/exclusion protein [Escherichia coli]|uniref:MbeD/MobD family mobilization/exclusion protein n=1 Tax=Escherichia coli TaxID=562 RepID=UPI0035A8CBA6